MTDIEAPFKYPKRICTERTTAGAPCNGLALAFIERPVCFTHSTPGEREQNREAWDAYVNLNTEYSQGELPDDVIIKPHVQGITGITSFKVIFGYRADVVLRMGKIAGSKFHKDPDGYRYWVVPMNRLQKVLEICYAYFSEVVLDGIGEIDVTTLPGVQVWRRQENNGAAVPAG